jgi:Fe-S oxidoreductase
VDKEKSVNPTTMQHRKQNNNALNTTEVMTRQVSQYIDQCIRCHRCMDVCPVTKGSFTIEELNEASRRDATVPQTIKDFTFNCVQCGKCVPVCPMDLRRDYMVRYIKYKLRNQKPRRYSRYLLIKGPTCSGGARMIQKLFIATKKFTTRDLAGFMETMPLKKTEVLFYPGCYVYSKKTMRQTLRLLNHIGCSYSILGGVTTCCGAPHRLQGEFEDADLCLEELYKKIKTINPKIILTSCAECFEELKHMKDAHNETFEVLSVAEYLMRQKNKFPERKIRGNIILHDSCRFSRNSLQGKAAREAAARFGELKELPKDHASPCCYQWNHGNDPGNTLRRATYFTTVKSSAPTLVCNCLTCFEELKKFPTDVEVIDLLQLFEEALNTSQSKVKKP